MRRREITPERIEQLRRAHARYIQDRRRRGIPRDGIRHQKRYLVVRIPKRDRSIRDTEALARQHLTAAISRHNLPPALANDVIAYWERGTHITYTPYLKAIS